MRKQKIVRKDKREIITVSEAAAVLFLAKHPAKYGKIEEVRVDRGAPNEVVQLFDNAIAYNSMTAEEQDVYDNAQVEDVVDDSEDLTTTKDAAKQVEDAEQEAKKAARRERDRQRRAEKKAEQESGTNEE